MAQVEVRFTLRGNNWESSFTPVEEENELFLYAKENGTEYKIPLSNESGLLSLQEGNIYFDESDDIINERLSGLSGDWVEYRSQGFEGSGDVSDEAKMDIKSPVYGPDDIYVENKPFSLRQVLDLINSGDIELNPNFQRNFIWDNTRQSRLIESILLGLPLPSIYLSQYNDGRLTVVDGLQRLTTIKRFLENKLILSNLEYLQECNGKKYSELELTLSPLRLRRFGQTQMMCFVIDYRSPNRLKFDLFRRLNTGGKPLNNQEIRNCLSRVDLQKALHFMTHSREFHQATDGSIKDVRMEAQEIALRFMYFYNEYTQEQPIGKYSGNMDDALDNFVDSMNNLQDFSTYHEAFSKALAMAYHLFGRYAFRKVYPNATENKRSQVNKLLMLVITVLLAKNVDDYRVYDFPKDGLVEPLAELIDSNNELFRAITWSTNSKWNIDYTFRTLKKDLFDKYLLLC